MAKIEQFYGGIKNINLTASVGKNGVNLKDDVMVVQAMLKYALEVRAYFRGLRFSEPTGIMDHDTLKNIEEYQRYLRKRTKTSVSVDGVISRAVGDKAFGRNGQWTILCLNSDVMEMRYINGGSGHPFEDLCRRYPQLNSILKDIPVGSLGLSLEPSAPRVGSLGLTLE